MLTEHLTAINIYITEQQKQQLLAYVGMLNKWNKTYNLTSVRQPQQMIIRHLLDSIVVEPHLVGNKFIDVGTGAGLPGIPLAIIRPNSHFTLLDSLGKRIRFLKQVNHKLGLTNVRLVQSRVEEFTDTVGFDAVISRAFASIQDMLNWCNHLAKKETGRFYALKGVYPADELKQLLTPFKIESIVPLVVPGLNEDRHLVIIS